MYILIPRNKVSFILSFVFGMMVLLTQSELRFANCSEKIYTYVTICLNVDLNSEVLKKEM